MKKKICKYYSGCPMKRFYENGQLAEKWVKNYCWSDHQDCVRYELAEKGRPHPDNMLPNGEIDQSLIN